MNTTVNYLGSLSLGQTIARLTTGSAMILFAMFYTGPFISVALLPLLAVYPITTGLIRVDPIYLLWQKYSGRHSDQEFCWTSRFLSAATAAGMIGYVMSLQQPQGWLGVLALLAVYPALAAIIGRDPFNAFDHRIRRQGDIIPLKSRGKDDGSDKTHEHREAA